MDERAPSTAVESAPSPEESRAPESGGSTGGSNRFFERVFRSNKSRDAEGGTDGTQPQDREPSHEPDPNAPPPFKGPASQQEFDQLVQSRTDAELYRREMMSRQRKLQGLEQQKATAAKNDDTYQVGLLESEILALKNGDDLDDVTRTMADVTDYYDRVFLDSYLGRLDTARRAPLLKEPVVGGNGRAALANQIADALIAQGEAQGEAKAEARLRRNPSFRKEVLHEGRSTHAEPDQLPTVAPQVGRSMDDFIRSARA